MLTRKGRAVGAGRRSGGRQAQAKRKTRLRLLARQQVKAHLQSADLEEFKQQYEKAKEDATKLLAEKEAEYKQQMEEAQAKIKAAQVDNIENDEMIIT